MRMCLRLISLSRGLLDNFGTQTNEYLRTIRKEGGVMLIVATEDYGEPTDCPFYSAFEARYAQEYKLRYCPLQFAPDDQYPPEHADFLVRPSDVKLNCRGKEAAWIALQIEKALCDHQ